MALPQVAFETRCRCGHLLRRAPEEDVDRTIVLEDSESGIYKRLVLKDDRIVGAVLYGETADGPWFFDMVRSGADTRPLRDTLIFGQSYGDGVPLDPYGGRCSLASQ